MVWKILEWGFRLFLAGLFFYAGFVKAYPPEQRLVFEMDLSSYQLFPLWAVIALAYVLPWFEMVLGVLLLVGWKLRYVAVVAGVLLVAFVGLMAITYLRGIEANCGCFASDEPISPTTLARDSLFIVMAGFLAVRAWTGQAPAGSSAA